ncbi:MAG: 3'-5' exonuclease [Donghicola eburneus]|nr:3'-5' exonuclease [Donghicola eburneus]MCI5038214.1 3'-5' exonuclease [Donghicola eburneus]
MFTNLGLRLRIFLIFSALAAALMIVVLGALFMGWRNSFSAPDGFITSGIIAAFGILAVCAAVWLLFDENVAKPILRLSSHLRTRAHSNAHVTLNADDAKYLGDLAPAAQAISQELGQSAMSQAEAVAQATARLSADRDHLTALLTEIPVAMILVNPSHQIVLYDGQAAEVLNQIAPPRMGASITEFFEERTLLNAHAKLSKTGKEVICTLRGVKGQQEYEAKLRPLGGAPGYMIVIDSATALIAPEASRPLTYDFALMDRSVDHAHADMPLSEMSYVVFDTETTGLLPHKDDVVQLGAMRVLRGRIVEGEVIDTLVDPKRPIPAASTKVHGISDHMVIGAPDFESVTRRFHAFCTGSVIVAHNAPFDMAFLHRQSKEMDIAFDHPILDTVLVSAVLFGADAKHTLDAICDRLGITIPEHLRHTALGDAHATAEVLCAMIPMLQAQGMRTFGDVIQETRKHGRLLQDLNTPA